ncbi:alpha/beta hydrolase [Blastococcus sp. MG754426]|uniref:alpha/beta hydrolase fold domain-containing protein n=1 Tax=unclassified Blastococcus TaxID=2619396 RepID=UPI001EF08A1B|nr:MULTISPECIES: alpha/beta hydrolase fold domain-containing protein [unclassified Blastococcus]MCF6507400.1 alpha/beta hydrolase [Blastococcus sp. MG754426]MCF6512052.1 alpha/beta hydrolase [Blastococcus sp. MG754427]MCF6734907.1 alpha/beta hydrolase [Blastococcus sp. KM273129]
MALDYPTLPGDIDHLIADDHAIVERQFQHLEAGRGNRRVLVDQVAFELALHAFAEETVLYPIWTEIGMTDEHDDAEHEHQEIKELLVVLGRTEPGEQEFEEALAKLIGVVRHHVDDEETDELPEFRRKAGPDRMAQLGREFLAAKRQAPTRPHPHAPDEGIAERIAGMLAKPLDHVRDLLSGKQKEMATDASGLLDPQAQAIVDAHSSLGPLPVEILEPDQARKQPGPDDAVKKVMADRGIEGPEPVGSVEDIVIPDAAGGQMRMRVYQPADAGPEPLPVVFWIHGGGWVLFDIDTYDASCRGLTDKARAMVVSPDYRRAPEAVFPAAHDDVLTAYRWVVQHAAELGGDPARIGIGGESVGGTMAAATVLQLAQAGEPVPAAAVCVYPLTTGEQVGESMADAADGRPLNRALLSWMAMHAFEGKPDAAADPRVDLLGWGREQLAVMPPTLVVTGERDVLRSQGQRFAENLQAAGVPTTHRYYPGVMHEFFGAAAVLDKAEQAQQEAAQHFVRAFGAARPPVGVAPSGRTVR